MSPAPQISAPPILIVQRCKRQRKPEMDVFEQRMHLFVLIVFSSYLNACARQVTQVITESNLRSQDFNVGNSKKSNGQVKDEEEVEERLALGRQPIEIRDSRCRCCEPTTLGTLFPFPRLIAVSSGVVPGDIWILPEKLSGVKLR